MPATPRRQELQSADPDHPDARFMTDVVAENVRDRRALKRLSQGVLASNMRLLGFDWTHTTVSETERGYRSVSIDELVALAIVLQVDLADLIDPTGADGTRTTPVDYGRTDHRTLPAVAARDWFRGVAEVRFRGPDSPEARAVEGREDEFHRSTLPALQAWQEERAQRRREEIIADKEKKEQQ